MRLFYLKKRRSVYITLVVLFLLGTFIGSSLNFKIIKAT